MLANVNDHLQNESSTIISQHI
ncbi:hypothetical protein F383_32905 [Gossypium arboreum]|uniref:Uncharacterized protein n=1 Tax=Gossypium arboreum TaxID=29729 RepID=A0A0B0PMK0_GOSAR|nr:hypothetical protein F383_32905 [Gossypium arboreum]